MNNKTDADKLELTIIGKGYEVEKMQKRLRCAARATHTDLHLSWQHEPPPPLNMGSGNSVAVIWNNKLVIDGLKRTEEIETLLEQLTKQ